jgi:hypothetical protein
MRPGSPIRDLHHALAHAVYQGFADIHYEDRDWAHYHKTKKDKRIAKVRRPSEYDIEVSAMFVQTWSSTALGFGGIGGQAFTGAYVVVLECGNQCAVYFGGRHAYTITNPNERFREDVIKQRMADVSGAQKRYSTPDSSTNQPKETS